MARPLPRELEDFVDRSVRSGKYRSREEVVQEALALLREYERKKDALKDDIATGLDELDRGEGQILETPAAVSSFFDQVKSEARSRSGRRSSRR